MSKTPTIDLLVSIVDNYGDMGFAVEFILAWQREYGDGVGFVIWTDDVEKMQAFTTKIWAPKFPIFSFADFWKSQKSEVAISLLHTPIPDVSYFTERSLVLRVDYISFDKDWVSNNGSEHISSTSSHKVIELIQSPLPAWAGLIPLGEKKFSKQEVAKELKKYTQQDVDHTKDWITIFAYPDTISRIDWLSFPNDFIVFAFSENIPKQKHIISLPLLPIHLFHSLLFSSEWSIVRGDMTGSMMLQLWKPYYWDIYRQIGWVHLELSDAFLDYIFASDEYREVHQRINIREGKIGFSELVWGLVGLDFHDRKNPNLIHEVKKHIDRFYFSL
jgi:hypothetical protein